MVAERSDEALAWLLSLVVVIVGQNVVRKEFLSPSLGMLTRKTRFGKLLGSVPNRALALAMVQALVCAVAIYKQKGGLAVGFVIGSGIVAFTLVPAAAVFATTGRGLQLALLPLLRDCSLCASSTLIMWQSVEMDEVTPNTCVHLAILVAVFLAFALCFPNRHEDERESGHLALQQSIASYSKYKYGSGNGSTIVDESILGMDDSGSEFEEDEDENCQVGPCEIIPAMWVCLLSTFLPPFCFCARPATDAIRATKWWPLTLLATIVIVSLLAMAMVHISIRFLTSSGAPEFLFGLIPLSLGLQLDSVVDCMNTVKRGRPVEALSISFGAQLLLVVLGFGLTASLNELIHRKPLVLHLSDLDKRAASFQVVMLLISLGVFFFVPVRNICVPTANGARIRLTLFDGCLLLLLYALLVGVAITSPRVA